MVASMSRGKKAYAQFEPQLTQAIARLNQLREAQKAAIDADAESYNLVMKAYKSAKESPDGPQAIVAALRQATLVPLAVAEKAVEVAQIATSLQPIASPNMKSDLITAVALANAALHGALSNVAINLDSIEPISPEDAEFVTRTRQHAATLQTGA
jgi:formiminotetrahydrofolate cyclodeaminase